VTHVRCPAGYEYHRYFAGVIQFCLLPGNGDNQRRDVIPVWPDWSDWPDVNDPFQGQTLPQENRTGTPKNQSPRNACYAPPLSSPESAAASRGDRRAFWTSRHERGDPMGEIGLAVLNNEWFSGRMANVSVVEQILKRSPGSSPSAVVGEVREIGVQMMQAHAAAVRDFGSPSAGQIAQYHYRVFDIHGLPASTFGVSPYTGSEPEARLTSFIWLDCK
jgi:hypothetical protein